MAQNGQENGISLKIVRPGAGNGRAARFTDPPASLDASADDVDLATPEWVTRADRIDDWADEDRPHPAAFILNVSLALVALGWIGYGILALSRQDHAAGDMIGWGRDIGYITLPLILLGVLWLMLNRTGFTETRRLAHSARRLQQEASGLDSVLALINRRVEENSHHLRLQGNELLDFGESTSLRMGELVAILQRERHDLDIQRQSLMEATRAAEHQMSVLLRDLPKATQQSLSMIRALTQAGTAAQEQAVAMETALTALSGAALETERTLGGAAQRLTVQMGQIQTGSEAARAAIADVTGELDRIVDGHLARTASAADDIRSLINAQGQALIALTDQARAGMDEASRHTLERLDSALGNLGQRLDVLHQRGDEIGTAHITRLQELSAALMHSITAVQTLHEDGMSHVSALSSAFGDSDTRMANFATSLETGHARITALVAEAETIERRMTFLSEALNDQVPRLLATIDARSAESLSSINAHLQTLNEADRLSQSLQQSLAASTTSIKDSDAALTTLATRVSASSTEISERMDDLRAGLATLGAMSNDLASQSAPQLLDALVRVREVADKAATKAREAINAVIPDATRLLAEKSEEALSEVFGSTVARQLDELGAQAEAAVGAAQSASERLMRQMLTIADTTATVEQRLIDEREARQTHDSDNLSRRVAMLIESLNSTSIDVAKLLSTDVTDTAWAAYLKGDRGVFTRRAVRLLDTNDARAVLAYYNDDTEFRDQVNRYIHDFEAMLRQVLATRDGSLFSVTLLSSDMGKLYVALAQAIERLRAN